MLTQPLGGSSSTRMSQRRPQQQGYAVNRHMGDHIDNEVTPPKI
jgi:hypothetical protein